MAVVGDAHIVVRALTDRLDSDIRRGFDNSRVSARRGGRSVGDAFAKGFNSSRSSNIFKRLADGFANAQGPAKAITDQFRTLVRLNYTLSTALGVVVGGISSVLSGIVSLLGAAGGAAASLGVLGNAGFALAAGMIAAKIALGGVGKALSALNRQTGSAVNNTKQIQQAEQALAETIERNREALVEANNDVRDAQLALNEAIKEGQEEIQQLGFEAEDAALSEQKAALELGKAREALARVQDLPPNSRARKKAELAYQEAELNLRKAKDRSADLNKEQDRLARTGVAGTDAVIQATQRLAEAEANKAKVVRDGVRSQIAAQQALDDAMDGSGGAGTDPFAGLTASQIEFVKNLQSLKPLLAELKESVAGAFLPPLWEAIKLVADVAFPTIKDGLTTVARSAGEASKSVAKAITETTNLANLRTLFESSGRIIESFGRAIGNLYGALLSVLVQLSPAAEDFAKFLETSAGKFDAFMKKAENQGAIKDFFERSKNAAADFGEIFGNIFGGFGKIINANLGPGTGGQVMLDWLKEATQKFQDMDSTFEGAGGMREFFRAVAYNTKAIMQSVGALISELIKLGANQAITITFQTLEKGAPFIGQMMNDAVEAGPAMANLVVVLAEIGALLSDPNQGSAFFDGIRWAAEKVRDFLAKDMVQDILKVAGPITAFAAGLGVVAQLAGFMGSVLLGYLTKIVGVFAMLGRVVLGHPILAILAAVVGLMIYLYNTNEQFAASVNTVFAQISAAFGELVGTLGPVLANLVSSLMPVLETIGTAIVDLMISIVPLIGQLITDLLPVIGSIIGLFANLLVAIMPIVSILIAALIPVIGQVIEAIVSIISAIAPLIPQLINALLPAFVALIEGMMPLVVMIAEQVIPLLADLLTSFAPLIATIIEALVPVIILLVQAFVPLITMIMSAVIPIIMLLIQAFMPVVKTIAETVIPIIARLIEAFMPLIMTLIEILVPVILTLIDTFLPLVSVILGLIPVVLTLITAFFPLLDVILPPLIALIEMLMPIIKLFADLLIGPMAIGIMMVSAIIQLLTGNFEGFGRTFERIFTAIKDFGRKIVNDIIGIFEGMINFVIDGINRMIGFINSIKVTVPDWIKDLLKMRSNTFGFNLPTISKVSIPRLAEGGVVAASPQGTIAQIAEAGRPERVEPLDSNGMSKRDKYMVELLKGQQGPGTINITVNPSPGMDERELASAISREISFQMRRGAVA